MQLQAVLSSRHPSNDSIVDEGSRPWEVCHYLAVAYHKSGSDLMKGRVFDIFQVLGVPEEAIGRWDHPCYLFTCFNPTAFVCAWTCTPGSERRHLRACVWQRSQPSGHGRLWMRELLNVMTLTPVLLFMDMQEGVAFLAGRMMEVVEEMTAVFEAPTDDTHRLHYERATSSSDGFDVELEKLLTFWFEGSFQTLSGTWRARLAGSRTFTDFLRTTTDTPTVKTAWPKPETQRSPCLQSCWPATRPANDGWDIRSADSSATA